jgi:hypothetical protein
VSDGLLTCWKRSKNFSEKMFPHNCWNMMLKRNYFLHRIMRGCENWFYHFDADMEWQRGMETHNTAKEKGVDYNVLSLKRHGNYLRLLKVAYWSSFCSKGKPSMLFITFRCSRNFVIHCVKNVRGRRWCPTIWQCKAPHCWCVYWEDSEERLGGSPLSPYSLDLTPLDCHYSSLYSIRCANNGSHLSFTNCWNRILPQGNLHTSTAVAKTHWSAWYFAEK